MSPPPPYAAAAPYPTAPASYDAGSAPYGASSASYPGGQAPYPCDPCAPGQSAPYFTSPYPVAPYPTAPCTSMPMPYSDAPPPVSAAYGAPTSQDQVRQKFIRIRNERDTFVLSFFACSYPARK